MEFGRGCGLRGIHLGTTVCFCGRSSQKPPIMLSPPEPETFLGSIPELLGHWTVSRDWAELLPPVKQSYKLLFCLPRPQAPPPPVGLPLKVKVKNHS